MTTTAFALILVAYLLGSLSAAHIVAKAFNLPDPTTQGSGNPGATNMLRYAGKGIAALVLLLDMLKGSFAVWLGLKFELQPFLLSAVMLAVFLGHLYPVFFRFKGGKGVATALGTLWPVSWLTAVCLLAVWLIVAVTTRYSSLAAITASLSLPLIAYFLLSSCFLPALIIMVLLLLWRHRNNIINLLAGDESRIGSKVKG